jgi:mannan endo-1,4-beta-mannosidase
MKIWSLLFLLLPAVALGQPGFVTRRGSRFQLDGNPYYYVGTNYWYGSLLPLHSDTAQGIGRLQKELDFLKSQGVDNLRLMAGAEGSGLVSGVERVGPPLQPRRGQFDESVLDGLDILLQEMAKRKMKAVIFFSNNWEWSGGFLQYLHWNGLIPDSIFRRRLSWEEQRDYTSLFYQCPPCREDYLKQVALVLGRVNHKTGLRYVEDPTIMAWEIANEPRPMRPASNEAYLDWIGEVARFVKERDPVHLLTTGHEGEIGTESMELFEQVHSLPGIDYLTIHIWPRNWGWYERNKMEKGFKGVITKTTDYIDRHLAVAGRLNKPLVVEEFGFPRDGNAFSPQSTTKLRDAYYNRILQAWQREKLRGGALAGINFWAFNGTARPVLGQPFWKPGDPYMGDPPMEEQGLYGVFDSDASTWKAIRRYRPLRKGPLPLRKGPGAAGR